jgi:hypothetical protein
MEQTIQILNQILPIVFLIFLGIWIRYKNFLTNSTIDALRKIVVNFSLPAVLLLSFLSIELRWTYFIIFSLVFVLCILLFFLGKWISKLVSPPSSYFPFLTTGFEYGMLGVSLFGAAYGLDRVGYIAIIDLGHEIFIWFVFLPLLLIKREGAQKPKEIFKAFLSAPVVIAILSSIFLNLIGGSQWLYDLPVTGALMATLDFLGKLSVPLILMIIGYSIHIDRQGLREALLLVGIRLGILIPLAVLLNKYLLNNLLGLEPFFQIALFTLLILPPPFIVPLYARGNIAIEEKRYINNVLTIHTIISVVIFLGYFLFNPVM